MIIPDKLWNCWHLWQLRTTNYNQSNLTIKSDTGQQFLRCFSLIPQISAPKRKPPSSQLKHRWYGPWSSFLEVIICTVCASNIRISSHYCQHELWRHLPRPWSFDTVHSFQCRSTLLFSCLLLRCWTWTMSWLRLGRILFWNGIKKSRSGHGSQFGAPLRKLSLRVLA